MGRGRPKKRKDPPEDNIVEPEPKSSKQQERVRETAARSNKINYKVFVDSESSEEEDPNVCPLCEDRNDPSGKKNRMIGCDKCDKWYHWSCVGITQKNKPGKKDDWFCPNCRPKQNGEVNPVVKTLAQKKSFDLTDTSTSKHKESWITSSKNKTGTNNSSEKEDTNEVPSNENDDSSDELNSHQASSSSQKSSKPGSDIIQSPEVDDSMFQDFLSEKPLVISEEPEVRLKIQLSKKTDFKGEECGSVEPLAKSEEDTDSWRSVVDSSGARGLKLVPSPEKKESSSSVIKDIDGHSVTDGSDSNQHSTSRHSGGGEGEVRESKQKGMDFPNVLDELFNSDLPSDSNSIKTQQDEAKIQSITKNLEATGASILQQSQHNYSSTLPNILTNSRNDAMLSPSLHSVTAALNSASNLSTNNPSNQYSVPVDQSRLPYQGNIQNDLISKAMDGAGLKILSPVRLNEKHVPVSGSNTPGAADLSRVLVQHQQSGLAQATGPQNGVQSNSIFLNQSKPIVSPVASLPGPVTSIALASVSVPLSGLPVSGVVLSHPAQVRPGLPSVVTNQVRPGLASPMIRPGISLASNMVRPGVSLASPQTGPGGVSPQAQVRPGAVVASPLAPGSSPTVKPPLPGVRIVRPVRGGPVRMRGRGEMRPRMVRPPSAGAPGTPPGVRGPRPRGPSPRGRGIRGAPRGQPRPGLGSPRLVRPLQPGAPRQLRPGTPRGPRPPMAGTPRGPRPAQPSVQTPVRPPAPSPAATATVKPEVIDLSDDEEAPPPAKSATLDKLRACGISVSKQKAPQLPTNVRLPPGISLSGSSNSGPKRGSVSSSNGDSANKRVALDHNVASALTAVGDSANEPKQKVELELSDKQMNALRALGLL